MEPTQKPIPRTKPPAEDIDLANLFYQTGGAIHIFFSRVKRGLKAIGFFFLQILFFFRKNFFFLLAGALIGCGLGFYLFNKNGSHFRSEMTVRTNYNSSTSLYSTMDLFNLLISNNQYEELGKILRVSKAEAATLVSFAAEPVKSELIIADMYDQQFFKFERHTKIRMDSFWVKAIKYEDFKTKLTKFDYPTHTITVTSNTPSIFPKIQEGILAQVSSNELLQKINSSGRQANQQTIQILTESIESLDTLRSTYNKRLAGIANSKNGSAGNNITILDGNLSLRSPELDLYDILLELKDELKNEKAKAVIDDNILQVYAPFSSIGKKIDFWTQIGTRYAVIGFAVVLLFLVLRSSFVYLKKLEQTLPTR